MHVQHAARRCSSTSCCGRADILHCGTSQGGELNILLQLPWVDADMIKKITRKGGARSVAELMAMDEQERLELLVTSGEFPTRGSMILSY